VAQMVERARPQVMFHVATHARTDDQLEDVEPLVAANVLLGTQLLQAAVTVGRPDFVNTATFSQHRDGRVGDAVCLYAALKEAFETVVRYHASSYGLRSISLTLYDTYGRGDRRGKLLQLLRTAAETQQPLQATEGTQRIELVHIRDVVEAYLVAARRLETAPAGTYERFAVRTGQEVVVRDFAQLVSDALGRPVPVVWGAKPFRRYQLMAPPRLPVLPGWHPTVNLRDGIREVLSEGASSVDVGPASS